MLLKRAVGVATAVATTNNTESVIATLPSAPLPADPSCGLQNDIIIDGFLNISAGTGATAVTVRVRRGSLGGALVGVAQLHTMPAAPSISGSQPSVPPSGNATTNLVTNPFPFPVIVTLSTFTLTFVYVNGVQVGTTNAAYTVPAGGTISITYSVAGTWTWTTLSVTSIAFAADDPASGNPNESQVYVVTVQQTGGTGPGTVNYLVTTVTLD
jgi:hypothetical protein